MEQRQTQMKILLLLLFPFCLNAQIDFDKKVHFRNGLIISSATYCLIENTNNKIKHPALVSFGIGCLAGIGKEAYDHFSKKGIASKEDAIYTIGGALCATFVIRLAISRKGMPEPIQTSMF